MELDVEAILGELSMEVAAKVRDNAVLKVQNAALAREIDKLKAQLASTQEGSPNE